MEITATSISEVGEWSETDRRMMARALDLAAQGIGRVSPGPLVGCVITTFTGEIIGEGFYVYDDVKHAETLALEQAGNGARGAIAYVSLEPHAHFGKTPPCTDALMAAGIRRVVAPIEDPNPRVCGQGFDHLRAAGIEVHRGLLAREAEKLNEKYLHFMKTGRPFVHLKLATSLDGKIATRAGDSRWITSEQSRVRAHELRHEYDAILVGAGTARFDDPLLTDRSGRARRKPLVRIVLDRTLQLTPDSPLASTTREAPVVVFTSALPSESNREPLESRGVEIIADANGHDLLAMLEELGKRSLQSVLVEGGATVAGKLIDARLVNKITFFIAPLIIGGREATGAIGGTGPERIADTLQLADVEMIQRGRDLEITGYPVGRKDEGGRMKANAETP
ncbi:MAG: bifunctional diaminohydroxyphosphoribosylaminopyrimidine deaminase/5-amino-6-(5-phosphoribosylamino)uracil reductase RibD [Pyrinomonadaceae bacterium]